MGVACAVVTALLTWLLLRSRIRTATQIARLEGESKIAELDAKLQASEKRGQELGTQLSATERELDAAQSALSAESARRAAAEEKNTRIPELQSLVERGNAELRALDDQNTALQSRLAELGTRLEEEREQTQEKVAMLTTLEAKFSDAFRSLSAEALQLNNQSFLGLAKATLETFQQGAKTDLEQRQVAIDALIKPVKESLDKVDSKIQEMEKARQHTFGALSQQLLSLSDSQNVLRQETTNLVKALRSPVARGRWGEMQLRRVVEMAGMLQHCDFVEQVSTDTEEGRQRPDLIVKLPGGKNIVIDAKTPLAAYLDAIDREDDGERRVQLALHARHVRQHIDALSRKSYWQQFEPTPEFVVLFLPGESFFSAALMEDPALIETGSDQRVLLATPTTLLALLKAVAYGWRQENIALNAREISALGAELYKRVGDVAKHWSNLGGALGQAVSHYNKAVASMETRVLVTARKFKELDAVSADAEVTDVTPVETTPRPMQAPELSLIVNDKDSR